MGRTFGDCPIRKFIDAGMHASVVLQCRSDKDDMGQSQHQGGENNAETSRIVDICTRTEQRSRKSRQQAAEKDCHDDLNPLKVT